MAKKPIISFAWLAKQRLKVCDKHIRGAILDVGCGNGHFLKYFKKVESYYGVDIKESQIKELKERHPRQSFKKVNLDEEKITLDKKFDTILLLAVIEHIFNQKFMMKNLLNHLKPNGIIAITTPTYFGNDIVHRIGAFLGIFTNRQDGHIVIYNKRRFRVLARELGIKMVYHRKFQFGCNQLAILKRKESGLRT